VARPQGGPDFSSPVAERWPHRSQEIQNFFCSVLFNLQFFPPGLAIFDGYCGIASGIPAAIKTPTTKKMTDPIIIFIGRFFSL
jgi:hypothetical protein